MGCQKVSKQGRDDIVVKVDCPRGASRLSLSVCSRGGSLWSASLVESLQDYTLGGTSPQTVYPRRNKSINCLSKEGNSMHRCRKQI